LFTQSIDRIKAEIYTHARSVGRDPAEIKLLAVTKTHSAETIAEALKNGIQYIAESRVQECEEKIPLLKGLYKEFHFIGHLQSNKIAKLLSLSPTLIHSIDKYSTAEKINSILSTTQKTQDILIEVNTSGEYSKQGIPPDQLSELILQCADLPNIKIKGLMTISEHTTDPKAITQCFQLLKKLFDHTRSTFHHPRVEMQYLSMGMSDDFPLAIAQGSNILRIGSAIFGDRPVKNS